VAEKKPELVADHLEKLAPALKAPEPQTKWMTIRTFGLCAHLNPEMARRGIKYAKNYLKEKQGLCLSGSAELYLGDIGALSEADASKVFPILEFATKDAEINEVDWILEAFMKIVKNLDGKEKKKIEAYAVKQKNAPKKSTQKRVSKLLKVLTDS